MSKVFSVEVTVGGRLVATVTQVPAGHVRRGADSKRPIRWTTSHNGGRLEWVRTLAEVWRRLAVAYPQGQRRLVREGKSPWRKAA